GTKRTGDVEKAATVRSARTGHDLSRLRIDHVAHTVHRHDRGDNEPARETNARCADPALHGTPALRLADGGAGARTDTSFGDRAGLRALARLVAGGGIGANLSVADAEIEEDRRRHDRHFARAGGIANAALVEITHHARRR